MEGETVEAFMNYPYFEGAPPMVNFMISAVLLSVTITTVVVMPLLILLGWSVKRSIKDSRENWTTVKTVPTQGYVYQVHKETGKRRIFSLLPGDTSVNKAWLKGETDVA